MTATDRQISYALALLDKAGYSATWMNREHAALGATMRQRSGRVRDWLAGMERHEISNLIDRLKTS